MTGRGADGVPWEWAGLAVCVAGIGISGRAAAETLLRLGARVTVVDGRAGESEQRHAGRLGAAGASVRLGDADTLPAGTRLVVTSPGWRPGAPLLAAAAAAGTPVWGDVELAWRLRADPAAGGHPRPAPWLAVTGTNGKTTTVRMLAAMLAAAGHRTIAAGNVGTPVLTAVLDPDPYDVIAVELSSFQLHWAPSLRPFAATVLNVAPDHLDWHGSLDAYARAKAAVYAEGTLAVVNADDAASAKLAPAGAGRAGPGGGTVSFTLGAPGPGQLGVAEDLLVDRAFVADPGRAEELAALADVRPLAPHNVSNALAAAALARSFGVPARAVRDGLRAFRPDPHRIATVGSVGGVDYVDDSKATNPHAAAASLAAYRSVVWVAGGLAKGAEFDELVAGAAGRLRGAVLLGAERGLVREALARHAPDIPVADVPDTDTGAMDAVVAAAARLARPGDVVLLAPACASMDMFADYGERGDAFAAAVRRLARAAGPAGSPGSGAPAAGTSGADA
jgi:UDP-N-acetylmuramoylalanine--D-glutamate ligase